MRLYGYCNSCRRFKLVDVRSHGVVVGARVGVYQGVCAQCEEEPQRARETARRVTDAYRADQGAATVPTPDALARACELDAARNQRAMTAAEADAMFGDVDAPASGRVGRAWPHVAQIVRGWF